VGRAVLKPGGGQLSAISGQPLAPELIAERRWLNAKRAEPGI